MFSDPNLTEQEQVQTAEILARYAASDDSTLLDLALKAKPRQFVVISKSLPTHAEALQSTLLREINVDVSAVSSEDDKDRFERRRANAILLFNQFGTHEYLWSALKHRPDPRLRSFLIDHLQKVPTSPAEWIPRLSQEDDSGARQALVLVLGGAARDCSSATQRTELPTRCSASIVTTSTQAYTARQPGHCVDWRVTRNWNVQLRTCRASACAPATDGT